MALGSGETALIARDLESRNGLWRVGEGGGCVDAEELISVQSRGDANAARNGNRGLLLPTTHEQLQSCLPGRLSPDSMNIK